MSDAFIGAIIGGLIAALPGLVSALLVLINSNAQRKHELTLRRIEIYETERRDALLQFGSVLFQSIRDVNAHEYYSALGRASAFLHKTPHFARRAPPCAPAAGDCQKVLVDRRGESCYSFVDFERRRLAESFQSNLLGTAQTGLRPYGQPGPLPTGGASCHY